MTKTPSSFLLSFPEDQGSSEYPAKITFEQIHIPPLDAANFLQVANNIVTDPETGEPIKFDSPVSGSVTILFATCNRSRDRRTY